MRSAKIMFIAPQYQETNILGVEEHIQSTVEPFMTICINYLYFDS